ncbi:MAG: hypothetical protein KDE31_08705, partial [Caldilineaceae bacterium]|nr:hypothetical protein [Caldilineaceae bacterium]
AKVLPEGETDWQAHRPLGISCAAVCTRDSAVTGLSFPDAVLWFGHKLESGYQPAMSKAECAELVKQLRHLTEAHGFTIATVNGVGFDFQILAEESGMWRECADLALNHHCDLMLMSVCGKGWRTGLDAFAVGAGVESKLKEVALNDGSILQGMDGAKAPELWAKGEYEAVLACLKQDVIATLQAAETAVSRRRLAWTSSTGRDWWVRLNLDGTLPTVAEMLTWPRRDVSWLDDPPNPLEICGWALELIKKE